VPLLKAGTVKKMLREHERSQAVITLLTAVVPEPYGLGRIIRKDDFSVERIVEERDAARKEKMINEVNSGIYCFQKDFLFKALKETRRNNAQKEFYLTDVIGIARKKGLRVHAVTADDYTETLGINTRIEMAEIEWALRSETLEKLMLKGVTIIDPQSTVIDSQVSIGRDTVIYPNTEIYGNTRIGEDCTIRSHSVIRNTRIGRSAEIKGFVFITDSVIGDHAVIGPFSHFRPETVLRENVKIGNFVEVKKSVIGAGSKAPHLTYIGDSTVGKKVNIGAGTITCNYDGKAKHRTIIKDEVFVGSDTQFVAPVKVGKGAMIASGTTVTEDIPPYSLTLSRTPQVNKEGWVLKKREEEKKKKEKK
jgi:bifunctional UDP-N-acetylglucosamine pyrophosphorylase/glucosamine-1-phosphate N-acetyltransferase